MAPYHPVDEWSYTEDEIVVKVTIATTDDDAYPSGWRYALHYGTVDGETLLRYDNAHEDTKATKNIPGKTSSGSTFRE